MQLLDTNVVSELRKIKSGRANRQVSRWAASAPVGAFFISVITLMELETGVRLVERRDTAQGALLRAWLDTQVIPGFAGRVLPVDAAVALRCAALHVPDPRPERDATRSMLTRVVRSLCRRRSSGRRPRGNRSSPKAGGRSPGDERLERPRSRCQRSSLPPLGLR